MSDFIKIIKKDENLPTVIAFSSVNTPKGKFKPYRIVESANVNIIFVNDDGNRWYQNGIVGISPNSEDASRQLVNMARDIGNGNVVTFGTSMGAFGAILFSILGEADGCLAFGVEFEIGSKGSRSELFLKKGIDIKYPSLKSLALSYKKPIYLFSCESDEIDMMSFDAFKNITNVNNYIIKGMMHPGVQAFDIDNVIADIIEEFANEFSLPDNLGRANKISSDTYDDTINKDLYQCMMIKKTGNNHDWLKAMEKLCSHHSKSAIAFSKLGEAFQKNGQVANANAAWNKSISICEFQYEAHAKLAANLRREGKFEEAKSNIIRALELNPYCAHSHHTLGLLYENLKDYPNCEISIRKAIFFNKGNKSFKSSLERFLLNDVDRKKRELKELGCVL